MNLSDDEFLRAFEAFEIPNDQFHHRDHIRLAWICLHRAPPPEAEQRIAQAVKNFATHLGHSEKYHHTITLAWMRLVAKAPWQLSFDELIAQAPQLLDKNTLARHYSSAILETGAARNGWVEPDLEPFE